MCPAICAVLLLHFKNAYQPPLPQRKPLTTQSPSQAKDLFKMVDYYINQSRQEDAPAGSAESAKVRGSGLGALENPSRCAALSSWSSLTPLHIMPPISCTPPAPPSPSSPCTLG